MTHWRDLALCASSEYETNAWFPERSSSPGRGNTNQDRNYVGPRSVCKRCPVIAECGAYAISEYIADGMWGGLTPDERKRERKLHPQMRPCALCGTLFQARRRDVRYCGPECRDRVVH
jgi:hypothetical protein